METIHIIDTAMSPHPCHRQHRHNHKLRHPATGCHRRIVYWDSPEPPVRDDDELVCATTTNATEVGDDSYPDLIPLDSDEDCTSLSSYESDFSYSARSNDRRVSFAATLVTEVKTRPFTNDNEKGLLFYTQSETDR